MWDQLRVFFSLIDKHIACSHCCQRVARKQQIWITSCFLTDCCLPCKFTHWKWQPHRKPSWGPCWRWWDLLLGLMVTCWKPKCDKSQCRTSLWGGWGTWQSVMERLQCELDMVLFNGTSCVSESWGELKIPLVSGPAADMSPELLGNLAAPLDVICFIHDQNVRLVFKTSFETILQDQILIFVYPLQISFKMALQPYTLTFKSVGALE